MAQDDIPPPCIERVPGGYHINWVGTKWELDHITIWLTNLREDSRQAVTAELDVNFWPRGDILSGIRVNLTSAATRESIAKQLDRAISYEGFIHWHEVIEWAFSEALKAFRQGEPVVDLWTDDEIIPPEFIIKPLIVKNYPNMLFGDPGATKSNLALVLCVAMMLPWHDNPLGLAVPEESVKPLILDWETDKDTTKWQESCIRRGMNLPPFYIPYRRCTLPLCQDLAQIQQHISRVKADIIIIDSLGYACGGELKEASSALSFFTALRQLETTSLILAHPPKEFENRHRSIYGSVFFEAQARNIWEIKKSQEEGSDEADVALFHRKPPPFSKTQRPMGFKFMFGENEISIMKQDPNEVAEFVSRMSASSQIYNLIKNEDPKETVEILEILRATNPSLTRANVDVALSRLRRKELIVKNKENRWGLLRKDG